MFDLAATLASAFQNHQDKNFPEAERLCNAILEHCPKQPDAFHLLGLMANTSGDPKTAIRLIRKAIKINPSWHFFYNSLGVVEENLGRIDDAIASFQRAVELKPDYTEAHLRLGKMYYLQGKLQDSANAFLRASQTDPQNIDSWNNLGVALMDLRNYPAAMEALQKALALNPAFPEGHANLGNVLQRTDNYQAAIAHLNEAIRLRPTYPEAWNTLGLTLHKMLDPRALPCVQRSVECNPEYAEAHFNLALLYLLQGRYEEGWKEYEWRWKAPTFPSKKRNFPQPQWFGENLAGKRLLVHAEQGHGDTIQFVRFLPMLTQYGGEVILEVQPALRKLLSGLPGVAAIVAEGEALPPFDLHCPMMSLPFVLETKAERIPPPLPLPYLADQAMTPKPISKSGLRVGLVWAGSASHRLDHLRSIPLAMFAELGRIPGVSFISLLKGPATAQIAEVASQFHVVDACSTAQDFTDVAEQIKALDLVISVDTAVAHLAATMGKPTWILVPFMPDWRWFYNRQDSPWYPSVRLFRQRSVGDWKSVIDEVAKELSLLAGQNDSITFDLASLNLRPADVYSPATSL